MKTLEEIQRECNDCNSGWKIGKSHDAQDGVSCVNETYNSL